MINYECLVLIAELNNNSDIITHNSELAKRSPRMNTNLQQYFLEPRKAPKTRKGVLLSRRSHVSRLEKHSALAASAIMTEATIREYRIVQMSESEVDFMVSQNALPSRKHFGGFLLKFDGFGNKESLNG